MTVSCKSAPCRRGSGSCPTADATGGGREHPQLANSQAMFGAPPVPGRRSRRFSPPSVR